MSSSYEPGEIRMRNHRYFSSRTAGSFSKLFYKQMQMNTMHAVGIAFSRLVAISVLLFSQFSAHAVPANPAPVELEQEDGKKVTLRVRGDEYYNWFEDAQGYTVVRKGRNFVYATRDAQGDLQPTSLAVGKVDPAAHGLEKRIKPTAEAKANRKLEKYGRPRLAQAQANQPIQIVDPVLTPAGIQRIAPIGQIKNLVVLCRFSDHPDAFIRPQGDYNVLFNNDGPSPGIAPSGSVKDCYKENSYGLVSLESTVVAWVTLPQTEAFYANGQDGTGLSYPRNAQGMVKDALDLVDQMVDFGDFDNNGDGFIDSIAVIHSGYGAEFGGGNGNRIWSHRWALWQVPGGRWTSSDLNANGVAVKVFDYHTEPALTGNSGNSITSVGVIAHETGHFFGLPDLYDTDYSGSGAGIYCMMANSWGYDGSGVHPPHFSAWSKIALGWVSPVLIAPGTYQAPLVEANAVVYKVSQGFPNGEYLLIENRQPYGFESTMPQGGLAIWHIDEAKFTSGDDNDDEGYPGQSGWPGNGNHYAVALLQADGSYGLERGINTGDAGDLYHGAGVAAISPSTVPNTHAYQNGNVLPTAITINSISLSGSTMQFTYQGPGGPGGGGVPFIQFESAAVSVQENTPGFATITVTNIGGSAGSVEYATLDGTALSGVDYLGKTNVLTFASGELSKSFTVPILDNAFVNADKTVNLTLYNPGPGVVLGITNAVLTIVDDERQGFASTAGQILFSVSQYWVTENETTQKFSFDEKPGRAPADGFPTVSTRSAKGALVTIVRTNGATGRVLVDYTTVDGTAAAGTDYTTRSGTLVLDHYQMSTNILIPVRSDNAPNGDKTFTVVLSNPRPAPEEDPLIIIPTLGPIDTAAVTIMEVNETGNMFSFERVNYRIDEDGDPASWFNQDPYFRTNIAVDVILPAGGPANVLVHTWNGGIYGYELRAGSDYSDGFPFTHENPTYTDGSPVLVDPKDYEPNTIRLQFDTNERRRRFFIPIYNDTTPEFNEDIIVWMTDPSDGFGIDNGVAYVTIMDDDQPAGALDREWNADNVANTPDQPFNLTPGANSIVRAVAVQPWDSKTILGGDFTSVNSVPTRNRLARLNPNGSLDSTFNPGTAANGFVDCIIIGPDQKIWIGGGFSAFNGTDRNRIARLNPDGSLDLSFTPGNGVNGRVRAMALQSDGKIIIAGDFTTYDDTIRNGIARIHPNGLLDESFNPGLGPDGEIRSIVLQPMGLIERIVIGGEFTSYNGSDCSRIGRLNPDGSLDSTFVTGRGANDAVYSVALQTNNCVLIGGAFTEVDVYNRSGIARLTPDGAVDFSFDPGLGTDDSVYTIAIQPNNRALIGGIFRSFNGTRRIGIARLKPNGTLDTSFLDTAYNHFAGVVNRFNFDPPNSIHSIALQPNGEVMIGGSFRYLGGNPSDRVSFSEEPWRLTHTKFNRADKRTRLNIARLIGGITPGPGNIEFISTPYTVDENGQTMAVTLRRIDGRLGTIQAQVSTMDRLGFAHQDYVPTNNVQRWREFAYVAPRGIGSIGLNYFRVQIIDDSSIEGDETVDMAFSNPQGSITLGGEYVPLGGALGDPDGTFTIVDNDFDHGVFSFSSSTYTVNEGEGKATITIIRTNGSSGPVSVEYFTRAGPPPSATPGTANDYVEVPRRTLSFGPGETSKSFNITIVGDTITEFDENISIILTNAAGGAKLPGGLPTSSLSSILTIIDDDFAAGRLNFSSSTYTNAEDSGVATVTVTRTGGNVGVLSVDYVIRGGSAIHGLDYLGSTNGTLTWASGQSAAKTISWTLLGPDGVLEGTETINVALTNATIAGALGGRTNTTIYILDADSPGSLSFSQPVYAADENGVAANITVVRTGGVAGQVSADFTIFAGSATPGVDYVQPSGSGTLVLGPNQTSTNFTVQILDDVITDGDKTVYLQLSNFVNASPGQITNAVLTLIDDESFSVPAGNLDVGFDGNVKTDNAIYSIALQTDNRLLIAGDFSMVNDVPRTRIARLRDTGVLDSTFNAAGGPNNSVRSMLVQRDGKVVIGGLFTQVAGTNRNSIARLNIDGTIDSFFDPGSGANNPVYALALQADQKIVVGGAFNIFSSSPQFGVARVNTNGTLDLSFNTGTGANGPVYAVAVQADGKILVGGDFTMFNGTPRTHLVRLNPNGSLDNTFSSVSFSAAVRAIHVQPDGKIVAGGSFTTVGGISRNHLVRLHVNGTVDTTFLDGKTGANNVVYTIAQQTDGKLLVGGDFTTFNGVTRNRLTRLINDSINDGATDPTINFGVGCDNFVQSVIVQPDRKIVFAGGFTTYDEKPRKYIARIHGGSISGAGSIEYRNAEYRADESQTNAVITLRRIGGTTGVVSNSFATANGTAQAGVHYQSASGTLVFPQGETRKTFVVPIINDRVVNNDRTVDLSIGSFGGGVTAGPQRTATLLIVNDDCSIGFTNANFSVGENAISGQATIAVSREGATNTVVAVNFSTIPTGTATINSDYGATNGILTFLAGEVVKNFNVRIVDDLMIEPMETVHLILSNAQPTTSAIVDSSRASASLQIVDNDFGPGELSFSGTNFFALENERAGVTIVRSNGTTGIISVQFHTVNGTALSGTDYVATNGTVSFADGESSKTIFIDLVNDNTLETDERFNVRLSTPTGGATLGVLTNTTVTILDDDIMIVPAGATLLSESITTNNIIEPGETVRVLFALRNAGRVNVTNLTATLLPNTGVTPTNTVVRNYGFMPTNSPSVSREFSFRANGANGTRISAVLDLKDNGLSVGTAVFEFTLGQAGAVFANTNAITIIDPPQFPATGPGTANPYPAQIDVLGVAGPITKVTVTLHGLSHSYSDDIEMLLVSPSGHKALLMADVGGNTSLNNVTLTFDDNAVGFLPDEGAITTGSYRLTKGSQVTSTFPDAPAAPYSNTLSVFNGSFANGLWSLYVLDDGFNDVGAIANGWSLSISSTDVVLPVVDLSTTLSAASATTVVGAALDYFITVTNHGPASATNVVVTANFSASVTLVGVTNGTAVQNNPQTIASTITGVITNGAAKTLRLRVKPTASGELTNLVVATSPQSESFAANNNASVIVLVAAAPTVNVSVNGNSLVLAWPASASGYILESSTDLITWGPASEQPTLVGDQYVVSPAPTQARLFYRLRSP